MHRTVFHFMLASVLAGALASAAPARATDFVPDQQYLPEIWSMYSISSFAPIGQTFTPSATALNVVVLHVDHTWGASTDSSMLFVRVHADSMAGPVLGESGVVTLRGESYGEVRFEFPIAVVLTPGRLHAIEVVLAGGQGNPMLDGSAANGYGPGDTVLSNLPRTFMDFWFRTGFSAKVPARTTTWGAIKAGAR